ncbi:MAG TPA: PEGA domain-containing protein, partial [Thermoanaerobaculia bacterium]|nr:PEGA domain-containing protein [Thermoanaerobaculia bacterium]
LFSVGVLAYELLTGQKPFTGDHISTVLYKIMNEAPPRPGEIDPAIPRALEAAVARALEKDRNNRYASCAELRTDLASSLRGISADAITKATVIHAVADTEKTVATPSGGLSRPTSAHVPPPAAPRPATGPTGTVAEVRLRTGDTGAAPIPVLPKKRGAGVRIAVGVAALVVLGVLGGYVALRSRIAGETRPTPVPTAEPTPAPAPPSPVPSTPAEVPTAPVATAVPAAVPTTRETAGPVTVTFESNQPAQLTVGGKRYSGLPAPVRVSLMPGKYVAVFDVAKFRKLDEAFEVRPGAAPFVVRVNFPAWGFLEVSSDPPGAEVKVDGKAAGATPLKKGFPVGTREVEVRLPGYEAARRSAEVREADVVRIAVPLKKGS